MTDPKIDGTGSGFGRYQGMTLTDIQRLFDNCVEEPSMRSISAILRITREQLDARGQLGIYPVFTWVAAALTGLGLVGSVFVLLGTTLISTRHSRRTNLKQEVAIREYAVSALVKVLESEPVLKPLTIEQEVTIKILMRKTEGSEKLSVLL